MPSDVGDAAVEAADDQIGLARRRQPVRDDDRRPPRAVREDALDDPLLPERVEGCGGFVQDHDVGIAEQGAGQSDPLPLPARQLRGAAEGVAEDRVEAGGQTPQPFAEPDPLQRAHDLVVGARQATDIAEGHVLAKGEVEAHEVLLEDCDPRSRRRIGQQARIDAAHADPPLGRGVVPGDEFPDGRLAGAVRAHDDHVRAGGQVDVHVVEDAAVGARVAEAHAVEIDRRVPRPGNDRCGVALRTVQEVDELAEEEPALVDRPQLREEPLRPRLDRRDRGEEAGEPADLTGRDGPLGGHEDGPSRRHDRQRAQPARDERPTVEEAGVGALHLVVEPDDPAHQGPGAAQPADLPERGLRGEQAGEVGDPPAQCGALVLDAPGDPSVQRAGDDARRGADDDGHGDHRAPREEQHGRADQRQHPRHGRDEVREQLVRALTAVAGRAIDPVVGVRLLEARQVEPFGLAHDVLGHRAGDAEPHLPGGVVPQHGEQIRQERQTDQQGDRDHHVRPRRGARGGDGVGDGAHGDGEQQNVEGRHEGQQDVAGADRGRSRR